VYRDLFARPSNPADARANDGNRLRSSAAIGRSLALA